MWFWIGYQFEQVTCSDLRSQLEKKNGYGLDIDDVTDENKQIAAQFISMISISTFKL